jgi:hypothetical protein
MTVAYGGFPGRLLLCTPEVPPGGSSAHKVGHGPNQVQVEVPMDNHSGVPLCSSGDLAV